MRCPESLPPPWRETVATRPPRRRISWQTHAARQGNHVLTATVRKAGPIGRAVRLLVAVCLVIIDVPVLRVAGWAYNLRVLALVGALVMFYLLMHVIVSRYLRDLDRWAGALLAIIPVVLVWYFGQGGGPLFGEGEGGTAAITFIAVSLLIDVVRGDSGCEVMAIPGLILGNRTHLACIAFCPIDALEEDRTSDAG